MRIDYHWIYWMRIEYHWIGQKPVSLRPRKKITANLQVDDQRD